MKTRQETHFYNSVKVSIIVPVYNVAAQLPRAVASVVAQTYRNWELVLVDDGSSDGSGELCDRFAGEDARIKALHQKNAGVVSARLNGFRASTGDLVMFLDGDDELFPSCLPSMKELFAANDVEMVQFGFETRRLNGKSSFTIPKLTGVYSFASVLQRTRKTPLDILGACIWNKCYRRELAEKAFASIGHIRISFSEDALFAFAAFCNLNAIYFDERVFYRYILRKGSAVHKLNLNIVREKEAFVSTIKKLAEDSGRYSSDVIETMTWLHSYEACGYIFAMLLGNHGRHGDIVPVLEELHCSWLFAQDNPEVASFRRRVLYYLLKHPKLYCLLGKIVLALANIKKVRPPMTDNCVVPTAECRVVLPPGGGGV